MICVLLSTYNGEKYLEEQLESLRRQEGVELKILVRDDGSKDTTVDIIKRWQTDYPTLMDFVQGENVGYAKSFTLLLQMAVKKYPDAEYYALCDQDDVWMPEKLSEAVALLHLKLYNKSQDIPVCYASNLIIVDAELNIVRYFFREKMTSISKLNGLLNDFCTGCTMVFNKPAIKLYIEHEHKFLKYHDKLLGMICLFMGELVYDNRSFIMYRQHGGNQIGAATSLVKKTLHGINALYSKHESMLIHFVEDFVESYKMYLAVNDIFDLSRVLFYNKKLFCKISLLFDTHIYSTNFFNTTRLKIKILLNKL